MDKEYKEFSYLEQKKKFMEFITPQKIRDILIEKVGKRDVVFDPCVGSGQLINKEFSRIIERELELDMNLLRCGLNNTKNIIIKLNTLIINYQKYINLVKEK
ncbi:MAG: N-6 DNA methylase [Cetobacterium sp.]